MDVLTVGSKNYVKASVLARELGYTSDYVGQLCRSGKVDAKLFGRSWYVEKDSIHEHKSNRYRTTGVKSIKAIRANTDDGEATAVPISNKQEQHFYIHNSLKASPRYVADDTELLPEIGQAQKMQGNLRINLADSSVVKISSASEKYVFDTPEMPKIKFKGSLTVTESADNNIPEGGLLVHPTEVKRLISEKKANNKVSSPKTNVLKVKSSRQISPVDLDGEPVEGVLVSLNSVTRTSGYFLSIVSSAVVSLAVVFILFGLEVHVLASGGSLATRYVFGIDNFLALASVYSAF